MFKPKLTLSYRCLSPSTRRAASLAEFQGQAQRRRTQCAYTAVCQCQLAYTSLCPGDATPSLWSSTLPCLVLAQLKQIKNAVLTWTITTNISLKNGRLLMAITLWNTVFFNFFSIVTPSEYIQTTKGVIRELRHVSAAPLSEAFDCQKVRWLDRC